MELHGHGEGGGLCMRRCGKDGEELCSFKEAPRALT